MLYALKSCKDQICIMSQFIEVISFSSWSKPSSESPKASFNLQTGSIVVIESNCKDH
jgi:hypothetical protein